MCAHVDVYNNEEVNALLINANMLSKWINN